MKKKKILPIIIIRFTQFQSVWLNWKTNPADSTILHLKQESQVSKIEMKDKIREKKKNQVFSWKMFINQC